jgi:hypothetical protein
MSYFVDYLNAGNPTIICVPKVRIFVVGRVIGALGRDLDVVQGSGKVGPQDSGRNVEFGHLSGKC